MIDDVELGRKALDGFAGLLSESGQSITAFAVPSEVAASADIFRKLTGKNFETGFHYHPQADGYDDYCGAFTAEQQFKMYEGAIKVFSDVMDFRPKTFRTGNGSANDATFSVTAELGFESCSHSFPGRKMTPLRSNWAGAPQHVHYAHPANRLLQGGLDLVEVPVTTDPDSMLWSGNHPQDLRVELFDAKNQRFMIDKILARESFRSVPLKAIVVLTHNIFGYHDPNDFRRQTLSQMIGDFATLAKKHDVNLVPATIGQIAEAYRKASQNIIIDT